MLFYIAYCRAIEGNFIGQTCPSVVASFHCQGCHSLVEPQKSAFVCTKMSTCSSSSSYIQWSTQNVIPLFFYLPCIPALETGIEWWIKMPIKIQVRCSPCVSKLWYEIYFNLSAIHTAHGDLHQRHDANAAASKYSTQRSSPQWHRSVKVKKKRENGVKVVGNLV